MRFPKQSFSIASKAAFALAVFLAPMRWRIVLEARPVPLIYKDFTDFLLFGSDICMLLVFIFWGISLLVDTRPVKFGPLFIWMPLLGVIVAALFSTLSSLDSRLTLYHVLRLSGLFLFYFFIINEIRSPVIVVISVVSQLIFQSAFSILQFFLQRSVGLQFLGEHGLDPAVSGVSVVSNGSERLLRAYGLAEHPNILGGCLAFGLIVVLGVYLHGPKKIQKGLGVAFLIGLLALFFTFSRSAFLGLFAGIGLLAVELILAKRWENLSSLSWLVFVGLLFLSPFVYRNLDFIEARVNIGNSFEKIHTEFLSVQERAALNRMGLRIFLREPASGVGVGSSPLAIKKYYPEFPGHFLPPHLSLLAAGMEAGVPGFISYLLVLSSPLLALIWRRKDLSANPALITASAVLLSFAVIGLFDIYPWLFLPGRLWQCLALGCWAAAYETIKLQKA
jgi:O-antigen ligase